MIPPADLRARVLASVQATPSLDRKAQRRATWSISAGVAVLVAFQFYKAGGFHQGDRPVLFIAITATAWALAIAALLLGLRSRGQLGPSRSLLWALVVGSLAVPLGVSLLANALYPETARAVPSHPGLVCIDLMLALSTAPLAAWAFLRRGSDPVHPISVGATIGAIAGCLSALLVDLTCRYSDPAHIALGHVLPAAIQVGVGALMGKLLISVRRERDLRSASTALGASAGAWLAMVGNYYFQRNCPTHIEPVQVLGLLAGIAVGGGVGRWVGPLLARRAAP